MAESARAFVYDGVAGEDDVRIASTPLTAAEADEMALFASEALPTSFPHFSAKTGLTPSQRRRFGQIATLAGLAGLYVPGLLQTGLWFLGIIVFALLIAWRFVLLLIGSAVRLIPRHKPTTETDLPIYTLLVPLHDEAKSVPGLADALAALDYPPALLDIKLLVEANDAATQDALATEVWGPHVEILALPEGMPLTKPRALNFGLQRAYGEFVVIYDAEDRPHPGQLKAALAAFQKGPGNLACVQAPLKAYNANASWISGHWALEYAVHFNLVLRAFAALRLPVPLGGTSNHFRIEALEATGGWDAWNVTEDADLGLRLARLGWHVGSILPPTLEEAPVTLGIWTAQRSRWIKGYMQTWLVLMRSPRSTIRGMGLGGFLATQLTLGGTILSALANGPLLLWVVICILQPDISLGRVDITILGAGYAVNVLAAVLAPGRFSLQRLISILTLPLYWPLQSLAAVRALYGLAFRPHFWAKTPHGIYRPAA
ncbi:MAG: glycosyltransferase family 2 protein [Hyphomonadaceae bacterium]